MPDLISLVKNATLAKNTTAADAELAAAPLSNETKRALSDFGVFVVKNNFVLDTILQIAPQKDSVGLSPSLVQLYDFSEAKDILKERAIDYITVDKDTDVVAFLRENSLAVTILSRSIQHYGRNYLEEVVQYRLKKLLKPILKSKINCEIDPSRLDSSVSGEELQKRIAYLTKITKAILNPIWKSVKAIPFYVKDTIIQIHNKLKHTGISPLQLVGTLFFLRFVTPVVTAAGPENNKDVKRIFLLVAKLIQLIVNKISTVEKANFLKVMEPLLASQIPKAEAFAQSLLDPKEKSDHRPIRRKSTRDIERCSFDVYLWLRRHSEEVEQHMLRAYDELTHDDLKENMTSVHASFGSDIKVAEDWQKVWKRVQKQKYGTVAVKKDGTSVFSDNESWAITSEASSVSDETMSTITNEHQEEDERLTIAFKCYHEPSKRLKFFEFQINPTFPLLIDSIQKRFGIPKSAPLRFSFLPEGQAKRANIEDERAFGDYLHNEGFQSGNTIVYSVFVN
mmetsp:Transcript_10981/g.15117  ORF Transcript_10981/g.15117 Transcript_10981/m.15117 type:complete len:508 (-) Transcript_10981:38-1561(-)